MPFNLPYEFEFDPTALADASRLLADCRAELPGVIPSALRAAYFSMLKDFCDKTNVWQEDIDVPLVANTLSYTITPAGNGSIIRLLNLFDSQDATERWYDRCSMRVPGALILANAPSTTGQTLVARVAKTVFDPVDDNGLPIIDAWIIQRYWDTLKAGTIARLMMQPMKTYTNVQLAGIQMKIYGNGRNVARDEVVKANVFGQTAWAFPQTTGVSRQRGT